jgi:hypothetical protein
MAAPTDRRLGSRPTLVGPGPERPQLSVDPLTPGTGSDQNQIALGPAGRLGPVINGPGRAHRSTRKDAGSGHGRVVPMSRLTLLSIT